MADPTPVPSARSSSPSDTPAAIATDHLEMLAVLGQDFATTLDIDQTVHAALLLVTLQLEAEGGAVFMLEDGGETLLCTACFGGGNIEGLRLNVADGIVGRVVRENRSEIVRDATRDPGFARFIDKSTGYTTRSIVCAPMSVKDERIGAIELVNKKSGDGLFSEDDLRVLEVMGTSAALAILNARMAEALVEQERVRRELELAAEIQRTLLPEKQPAGYPVFGLNKPARMVSGDFYDFFELGDGRICFNLGDVAGKGMNAALMMTKTSSLFRYLGKTFNRPGQLMARINAELCETATRGMFVTMIAGVYDPRTGMVVVANAGNEPPLVRDRSGAFTSYPAGAPPLGLLPQATTAADFPETEIALDGGTLYMFTDGVTEGYLEDGRVLGIEGLRDFIDQSMDKPYDARIEALMNHLDHGRGDLRDDLTMLAVDDGTNGERRADRSGIAATAAAREDASETEDPVRAGVGETLLVLEFAARPDRLKLVRSAVSTTAENCGCTGAEAHDVVLAVDEACQNVVRHAYGGAGTGDVVITLRREGDDLVILIRDFADPVDPARIRPPDLDRSIPGGLGVQLMREVMDEVRLLPPPPGGGNLLRMRKRFTGGRT